MVPESELVATEHGLVPKGQGWFVVSARETQWWERNGRGVLCEFERPLQQWDFVHRPPGTNHVIVGAGEQQCVVLAVGARDHSMRPDRGAYAVDEAAQRHGAGVERETTDSGEAYARFHRSELTRYREGWLPELALPAPPE